MRYNQTSITFPQLPSAAIHLHACSVIVPLFPARRIIMKNSLMSLIRGCLNKENITP
jgi:hypothetical protein